MRRLMKTTWLALACVMAASPAVANAHAAEVGQKKRSSLRVDHSTPEKVAQSFKTAAGKKDWKAMLACVTEESQKMLIVGVMFGAGFATVGDKAKQEALQAILKKHGIDPKAKLDRQADPTKGVKDKAALFGDLIKFTEKNTPAPKNGKPRRSMSDQFSKVELSNFQTKGDTATADVSRDGKKLGQAAKFKKIGGKWFVDFDDRSRRAPGRSKKKET